MDNKKIMTQVSTLETQLLKSPRSMTVGDAAALTALPIDDAKHALDALINKYVCRLQVTEQGDLVYDFGKNLMRRDEKTLAEQWSEVKETLWKAFTVFFKACISLTLVVYFVFFVVVLIAIVVAMLFGDSDSDSDSGDSSFSLGGAGHLIAEFFRAIFIWNTINPSQTYYATDSRGYSAKHYESKPSTWSKIQKQKDDQETNEPKTKSFVASIYDFVFGMPRVEQTMDDNFREIAAYARRQKGIVVQPELKGLAGWDNEATEKVFAESVARFGGEAKISDNGVLYGDFEEFTRTNNQDADAPVVWFWDEYEAPHELTGNKKWRNIGISAMNAFNLAFSMFMLSFLSTPLIMDGEVVLNPENVPFIVSFLLGWFPLTYSLTFFTVPALRFINLLPKRTKRRQNNIRKRIMKIIFQNQKEKLPLSELTAALNSFNKGEEQLPAETVEKVMNDLIYELNGEMQVDENGNVVYQFFRLQYEMKEVAELRKNRNTFGTSKVVFETE